MLWGYQEHEWQIKKQKYLKIPGEMFGKQYFSAMEAAVAQKYIMSLNFVLFASLVEQNKFEVFLLWSFLVFNYCLRIFSM